MDERIGKLTVYFDNPFWVGVFERIEDDKLSVCKVTFGAEPKDYEVFQFILKNYKKDLQIKARFLEKKKKKSRLMPLQQVRKISEWVLLWHVRQPVPAGLCLLY